MKIILASDSPRRKQLLGLLGVEYKAVSHKVNETGYLDLEAKEMVGQLAMAKALSIWKKGRVVIGSDLTVALKKEILGKPKDLNEAKKFLKTLSGKTHSVFCGVAVTDGKKTLMSVAESRVTMKPYNKKVIDEYVKKFEVLDKGGAYAIQFELPGYGSLVEKFEGGITTIIGLPLEYLANLLAEFGVKVNPNWREKCKIETGYEN